MRPRQAHSHLFNINLHVGSFGASKAEKSSQDVDLDHTSSSSGDDTDVQDGGDGEKLLVEGKGERRGEGGSEEGVGGCGQERPTINMLNQQPSARIVATKGGVAGGRGGGGGGRYDPNRYRLHFESESKEEIERRKRTAKSVPIVPLSEVSYTQTHTHSHVHVTHALWCLVTIIANMGGGRGAYFWEDMEHNHFSLPPP